MKPVPDQTIGEMWSELLRAFAPCLIAIVYAMVVLPTGPGTSFAELQLHQQAGSVGVPVSLVWSFYRWIKWQGSREVSEA